MVVTVARVLAEAQTAIVEMYMEVVVVEHAKIVVALIGLEDRVLLVMCKFHGLVRHTI